MSQFKKGDRVKRVGGVKQHGTVQEVTNNEGQLFVPVHYSVLWDGSSVPEEMLYPNQLELVA